MIRDRGGARGMNWWQAGVLLAGIFLAATLPSGAAAQSAATPAAAPAVASPAVPVVTASLPPATAAKRPGAQESSNATNSPKKHKVFTDDDIAALRARSGMVNDDDGGPAKIYGTMGACDADCEQEVKDKLGVAPEEEGEWKLQMTAARREIGEDRQWRELYWKGQQAIKSACVLRGQEASVPEPGGNDFQSQLERARQRKMFDDAEDVSALQMQAVVTGMNQYIQQFSGREAVRAVMMWVIGERLLSKCPEAISR